MRAIAIALATVLLCRCTSDPHPETLSQAWALETDECASASVDSVREAAEDAGDDAATEEFARLNAGDLAVIVPRQLIDLATDLVNLDCPRTSMLVLTAAESRFPISSPDLVRLRAIRERIASLAREATEDQEASTELQRSTRSWFSFSDVDISQLRHPRLPLVDDED